MDFASTRKISLPISLFLATLVFALSGCATPKKPPMGPLRCTTDCRVTIKLPRWNAKPEVPPQQVEVIVNEGSQIIFEISGGGTPSRALTELKADAAIFVGPNRRAVEKIRISQGFTAVEIAKNTECDENYRVKIDEEVMCRFKYDVTNVGNPNREPLDPWIIIRK